MTKVIAIQTILMLLVGILVVGIIVYLVYMYTLSPGLTEQSCRQAIVNWCTTCKTSGWSNVITPTSDVSDCWTKFFIPSAPIGSCTGAGTYCSQFGISD